mmetsp:Transcript_30601/g.43915  ORF Transcript_30601/g.43915 Transcript_30601/m.43915 type:complete len:251 (-) Transcript_30601:2470-3222(-)
MKVTRRYFSIHGNSRFTDDWINDMKVLFRLPHTHINSPSSLISVKGSSRNIAVDKMSKRRKAAVLVPICNRNGLASILFTVRTQTVSTHKGQVSFPGGHRNVIDGSTCVIETAVDCALRETYEELGSNIGNIRIIGECEEVPAVTGTLVTPVIGFIEEDVMNFEHFNPSLDEVDRVFTRSIDFLLDPSNCGKETYDNKVHGRVTMPVFYDKSSNGKEKIWGLTAFILRAVLDKAIVPTKPSDCGGTKVNR